MVVVLTGVHMAHVYSDATRSCSANGTCGLLGNLFQGDGAIVDLVHLSIALPLLLGVLFGATLIARETDHATNVLVWTQTVSRRRWLFTKIAAVLAATVVISAAVSALVTWWSGTPNSLYENRFEGAQFDTQNVLPIALALFGVALGIAMGSLFRRTLPAIAATVAGFVATRLVVSVYLRPHYAKTVTSSFALNGPQSIPRSSWTVHQYLTDPRGRKLNGVNINIPASCRPSVTGRSGAFDCLGRLGYRTVVEYHPASQYWRFQWTETGLFLALAALLVVAAVMLTLRRDA